MRKILLVNSIYYPDVMGGAEISVKLLAEDLANEGFDVNVVCLGRENETIELNGVKIHRIKESNSYFIMDYFHQHPLKKFKWHLKNLLRNPNKTNFFDLVTEINPDIILSQNLLGLGLLPWDFKSENESIQLIQTIRDYKITTPTNNYFINKCATINFKRKYQNVNVFVGISHFSLSLFLQKASINAEDIEKEVIPNKVPDGLEKNECVIKEPKSIAFVGQITREKGISIFLEAVSSQDIYDQLSTIEIVGEGPLLKDLKRKYQKFDKIIFWGKVPHDHVNNILKKLDFLIVPSLWEEPFGRVIIEAYKQKVIVLASNKGGIPEVIIDQKYLFNPDKIEELKEKILENIINDLHCKEKLREDVYQYSKKFTNNVVKYKEIFTSDKL